ncbi:triphosphoribosyl-dephospho-CoA synthase [Acidianus sp. RZ1]|uniref:triphosphoribosyl-dephospho-CoA synthase n=1 Tax=Acidianus sp. RZ1 TaxID=1540082 RepID=UPI0014909D90|nr:triphosphoribosyl-dephospho-CoA synthase [Acidianus sp. RZ1]NON62689.1 triphosphoribosyl-dephospho-CoA synthase [Acidianus sp. RZ1]
MEDIYYLCDLASISLSRASIIESIIPKPGNASRVQDIDSVNFQSILESALVTFPSYKEVCVRGSTSKRPIYDTLYNSILESNLLGIKYSIFGTSLMLIPIAYSFTNSYDINSLIEKVSQVVLSLDDNDGRWFLSALRILSPSYLGKRSSMDYRELNNVSLLRILQESSTTDSVAKNMLEHYKYSVIVYEIIKQKKCGFAKDIQKAFIKILSQLPDGLILRKHGARLALSISTMVSKFSDCPTENELAELNSFLISKKANPGSTADIIASGIALYLLEGIYESRVSNKFPLRHGCDRVY